ncbi:MAG: hypothetical protein R2752_03125 [Vicinamibacterales bacterium]
MKKLAIGCGVVALLAIVAGGIGVYYVMHRIGSTVASFAALGQIPDIEKGVENTSSYVPPDSGEFTEAQLASLLAVQSAVRQKLGDRFTELDAKYKTLSESLKERDATVLDAPALLSAYSDLAAAYLDAKRWQVEALNAQHLSLAEYRWIRKQAYAAMGLTVMNIDVGEIISDVKAGRTPPEQPADVVVGPTGPQQNITLVEAHRKALEDNVALAFLGL